MTAPSMSSEPGLSPAERLFELFRGAEARHGTYDKARLHLVGSKMEMKDENGKGPVDVKGAPTVQLWEKHLAGIRPLGISPLREDGMCRFGVIDIDEYDLDLAGLASRIERDGLPLVLTKSKSGGGHVWLFSKDWLPQAMMNAALVALAERLSHSNAETYPPRTGLGNWINMPAWSGGERCGIKSNGLMMTVEEFLSQAEARQQGASAIAAIASAPEPPPQKRPSNAERKLADFALEIKQAAEGGRAKLLYGRAKDMGRFVAQDNIAEDLVIDALMEASMLAGLGYAEAMGHIRNGLKDGKREPQDARGGNGGRYAQIEKIVILTGGEEKLWRVTVAGCGEITLPAKFVWRNDLFNQRCAEELRVSFRQMKADAWADCLDAALEDAETEALPREETVEGVLLDELQKFCTDRRQAHVVEEVLLGKPFYDDEAGRVYFRFRDLHTHLREHRSGLFKGMTMHAVGRMLRSLGRGGVDLGKTTKKLAGRTTELYWVRIDLFEGVGAEANIPLPPIPKPEI